MNSTAKVAVAPVARTAHAFKALPPPAVWAAFARQGQWKNWVLLGQLVLIALLILTCLGVAKTDPDVVVVDAEGTSHYVRKSAASAALIRFLAEQKSHPSDLTILAFTERFVRLFFAPNSSTIRGTVPEALGMMDARLKATTQAELAQSKVVEKVEALKVRTELSIDALDQIEQAGGLVHLKARLARTTSSLADASNPKMDVVLVELVERVVPRSLNRPDGLELAELIVTPAGNGPAEREVSHAQ